MRETVYVLLDLSEHLLRRWLVIPLLCGLLDVKDRFRGREKLVKAVFVAATMVFYTASNYLPAFTGLLYGNEEGMVDSRESIVPLFISLSLMLAYCLYFYGGRPGMVCYLVVTVYVLNELVMFSCHSLFVAVNGEILDLLVRWVDRGEQFVIENFMLLFNAHQILWQLSYHGVSCFLFYRAGRALGKNLMDARGELAAAQELFLAVPTVAGLCFPLLLRSIMYVYRENQAYFLMDEYPETKLLIPVISILCLLSILLSAYMLRRLSESSEKEMLLEVYQNRLEDMEEHMKDVEHLYEGIRGMRHDMKNHLADLEILLYRERRQQDFASEGAGEEIRRYLDGLCGAMEELDMKCSTGNPVTDVVVSRKMRRAEKENIPFECNFMFPENLGISAFDLSILLNNGLDNALEASKGEKSPFISLDSYTRGNMFLIEIKNAFTGELIRDKTGMSLQTKKANTSMHGLGIKNMGNCAEKYYGTLRWEKRDGEFLLVVMLQGENKNPLAIPVNVSEWRKE